MISELHGASYTQVPHFYGRPHLLRYLWLLLKAIAGPKTTRVERLLRSATPDEVVWFVANAPDLGHLSEVMQAVDLRVRSWRPEQRQRLDQALDTTIERFAHEGSLVVTVGKILAPSNNPKDLN